MVLMQEITEYKLACFIAIILVTGVQCQSNCSSFLHIPLLETEGGDSRQCDNCTAESHPCPPWYKATTDEHCVFGKSVNSIVVNVPSTMQTNLL